MTSGVRPWRGSAVEAARAIAPQLYAFTGSLGGATQGFITVALG